MTICPKCSYERKSTDQAPDWECPACGVVYAKVLSRMAAAKPAPVEKTEAPAKPALARPVEREPTDVMGSVLRLGGIVLVVGLMVYAATRPKPAEAPAEPLPDAAASPVPPQSLAVAAAIAPETELSQGLGPFSGVELSCGGRLVVDTGSTNSVKASGDVSTLQLQVSGGTLLIACSGRTPPNLHLVMPALNLLHLRTRTEAVLNDLSTDTLEIQDDAALRVTASGHVNTLKVHSTGGMLDLTKLTADEAEVTAGNRSSVMVAVAHRLKGTVIGATLTGHVEDGEQLDLQAQGGTISLNGHVRTLNGSASSNGSLRLDGLVASTATVTVGGAMLSELRVDGSLDATNTGSGSLVARGTAGQLKAHIDGGGRGEFQKLIADDVEVSIRGAGTITTTATHSLDATVDGSGQVQYRGNPAIVSPHIHGSGQVRPL